MFRALEAEGAKEKYKEKMREWAAEGKWLRESVRERGGKGKRN